MKKNLILVCAIAFTAYACNKEQDEITPSTTLNSVKYVTAKATNISETIDEVEASLNQAFGNVSGIKDDLSSTETTYQLPINGNGLVDFSAKTMWMEKQTSLIAIHQSNLAENRSIFAIDVVKETVKMIDDNVAEIRVVVYDRVHSIFGENRLICQLEDANAFDAAEDLTIKYNNCPLRDAIYYYEYVTTVGVGYYSYYYEENDFLFQKTYNNGESIVEPKAVWDYYFERLQALVIDQNPCEHCEENVVNLYNDFLTCGGGCTNYLHAGEIIYGKAVNRLEHFVP